MGCGVLTVAGHNAKHLTFTHSSTLQVSLGRLLGPGAMLGAGNLTMIKRVTSGAAILNTADRQGETRLYRNVVGAPETNEAGKRASGISGGLAEL